MGKTAFLVGYMMKGQKENSFSPENLKIEYQLYRYVNHTGGLKIVSRRSYTPRLQSDER